MGILRVAVLCNNPVALPALQQLQHQGVLVAVGVDKANPDFCTLLQSHNAVTGTLLRLFEQEDFELQLHAWLDSVMPDVVLLMTWPFRIPVSALLRQRKGFLNFHYGLLPQYRGSNPVFEQIRRKEPAGGITIHKVEQGIDTGDIILQQQMPITSSDTFGVHMDRLSLLGIEMLHALFPLLNTDQPLPATPQNSRLARYYKRPRAEDVTIKWEKMSGATIIALINACNPWNYGAGASLGGSVLGISKATLIDDQEVTSVMPAGTILTLNSQQGLTVITCDHKIIRLDVLYVNANFVPGCQLNSFGIQTGMRFDA